MKEVSLLLLLIILFLEVLVLFIAYMFLPKRKWKILFLVCTGFAILALEISTSAVRYLLLAGYAIIVVWGGLTLIFLPCFAIWEMFGEEKIKKSKVLFGGFIALTVVWAVGLIFLLNHLSADVSEIIVQVIFILGGLLAGYFCLNFLIETFFPKRFLPWLNS